MVIVSEWGGGSGLIAKEWFSVSKVIQSVADVSSRQSGLRVFVPTLKKQL